LSALHDAAAILIPQASEVAVRAVLRLLLDDGAEPAPSPVGRSAAERVEQRAPDSGWNELRLAVRTAMQGRGMGCDALAERLGVSPTTLRIQLGRTKRTSAPLQAKLRWWLTDALEAPAVAVPRRTFRGGANVGRGKGHANGGGGTGGQRGNGHVAGSMEPEPRPPRTAPEVGCCWEERRPGEAAIARCGAPTVAGRPWCRHHAEAFARGRKLAGHSLLGSHAIRG